MLFRTFRKFDVNKDGVVDFEEFKKYNEQVEFKHE